MRHDRADREQLSGTEALMWRMGRDPVLGSSFANIMLLDSAPDADLVKSRLEQTAGAFPRLHARVQSETPATLVWAEDPTFDIEYHVRRIALPAPATERQLLDLTAAWTQDPFDPNRPLWQVSIVENLSRGRAALVAKLHHSVTDGMGGLRLAASLLDPERHPQRRRPRPVREARGGRPAQGTEPAPAGNGPSVPEVLDDILHRLSSLQRAAQGTTSLIGSAATKAIRLATDRSSLERETQQVAEALRSVARQAFTSGTAKSPLWAGHNSPWRRIETLDVSLSRVKSCAKALGGTVNDVFVTAVAGGAADYHRHKGAEADELRMSMPVSTRDSPGNAFAPTRVVVPAGIRDPRERLEAVHGLLAEVKSEPALGLAEMLAGALNAIPDPILTRLARQQVETVDFAASNLHGSTEKVFLAGALMLADFPIGPTMGVAFNATVISYRSRLFMGLNVDTGAVDDPGLLRSCIAGSFRDLLATTRVA